MSGHQMDYTPVRGLFGSTLYEVYCSCGFGVLAASPESATAFKESHLHTAQDMEDRANSGEAP